MPMARRNPEKLTVISKGIHIVMKEIKESVETDLFMRLVCVGARSCTLGSPHTLCMLEIFGSCCCMKEIKELNGNASECKMSELESFIGLSAPEQIDILPTKQCNTKGSSKRIKGGKEKAMEQQGKRLILCKACGQQAYHDTCNFQTKLS